MLTITIAAVLLCLSGALLFCMYKNKNKQDSVFTKSLFRVKSVSFFPVISLVYTFFAVTILFFSLLIADQANGYAQYFQEELRLQYLRSNDEDVLDYRLFNASEKEKASQGAPKILVVGDSFVYGHGLTNNNQIWWSLMSLALERRGYACDVYAAGCPGASTYDEYLWLKDGTLLEDVQPDLILLGYCINDPDLTSLGMGLKVYDPLSLMNSHQPGLLFPNLHSYFELKAFYKISQTENKYNNSAYGYTYITALHKYADSPNIQTYNALVVQPLGELIRAAGIPMIVLPTPHLPDRSLYEPHLQRVIPMFEQAGLPVYNPFETFADSFSGSRALMKYIHASPVNPHCGPASSWLLGNYAADVLEQNYPSILGEKRAEDKSKLAIEINDWLPRMLNPQPIQESACVAQYTIEYPEQASEAEAETDLQQSHFLTYSMTNKVGRHVKLNFRRPVRLSSITVEGDALLSAKVYTLGLNPELGFDDQKPVRLGKRRGSRCVWEAPGERYVTSLLLSAKTKGGKQAPLILTIESVGGEEAFF